jgi:hypothetical protein
VYSIGVYDEQVFDIVVLSESQFKLTNDKSDFIIDQNTVSDALWSAFQLMVKEGKTVRIQLSVNYDRELTEKGRKEMEKPR